MSEQLVCSSFDSKLLTFKAWNPGRHLEGLPLGGYGGGLFLIGRGGLYVIDSHSCEVSFHQ